MKIQIRKPHPDSHECLHHNGERPPSQAGDITARNVMEPSAFWRIAYWSSQSEFSKRMRDTWTGSRGRER